jgi:hypothetical protein
LIIGEGPTNHLRVWLNNINGWCRTKVIGGAFVGEKSLSKFPN